MAASLQATSIVISRDVTQHYHQEGKHPLAHKVFKIELSPWGPTLRKVTSAIGCMISGNLSYLLGTSFLETQAAMTALKSDAAEAVRNHVYYLGTDPSAQTLSGIQNIPPLTRASILGGGFADMLKTIKFPGEGGKPLNFLSIATRTLFEDHTVGLLIYLPRNEGETGQIMLLDSKGIAPENLYLLTSALPGSETSTISCAEVLQTITAMPEYRGYSLFLTPNFQKTRDCMLCTCTMLAQLALQVACGKEPNLTAVIEDLDLHYKQIDALRAYIIQQRLKT